ncbi:transglycosylase SLT domain-containing protein [Roseomonas mucosa]|uniref:transglycosylase SLT domain-containing protein n=1 Tax=Roseomonas mucosa TaxID=207340 RepID=UPI0028CF44B0|nr:transglycosylase SLT domain-containing protein [Roseomonas mucosa]MDT8315419.1 transglycosylase SLT domain-containing protein [Roseomonas mucosa]MDT8361680.1 transglycosylase SLT domain-containing protein [Roseomonas mucosa]
MTGCEALAGLALFACLARDPRCLPDEHRRLLPELAAVAERESGFRPFAIRDETTGESLFPATRAEAVAIAAARDAAGRTLGLGWFQITHRANWRRHGLTVETALDPCENMRAGAAHLAGNLRDAAFQLYNSGRIGGAPGYAAAVARRAGHHAAALAAGPDRLAGAASAPVPPPLLPDLGRGRPGRDLVTGR